MTQTKPQMTDQHRATAEQWALIERMRHHGGHPEFSTIIELRDRIEALEAAAKPSHPAKPNGSLVKRVKGAINRNRNDVSYGTECAKASILEVAAWLREVHGWEQGAQGLEREALPDD